MAIYKCSSLLDACLVTHLMAIKSDQLPYLALKYRQSWQISNSFNKYNVLALQAEISKGDPLYEMWSPLVLVPIYLLKEIVASNCASSGWLGEAFLGSVLIAVRNQLGNVHLLHCEHSRGSWSFIMPSEQTNWNK